MANFPTSLDDTTSLPTRVSGDTIPASDSNDKNTAIIALETKVGSGSSVPTTTGDVLTVTGPGTTAFAAPSSAVTSVAGRTGAVVIAESDVTGLVSDLAAKQPTIAAGTTAQYYRGDKSFQTLNQDAVPSGTTNKAYTATEQTKLSGVATGATANSPDATLLARANHTGTQSADTLTDGTTNKAFLATERTKLAGIATGATANSPDATLLARANHTGTQLAATISDFSTAADARIAAAAGVSVASLSGGKIPSSQIPAVGLVTVQTAASQAAQLALTTQEGDVVVRTDTSTTYMRNAGATGTMADFTLLNTPADAVTSVNGATGVVVLGKTDVGLSNVDNTSDATKNAATATLTNKTIDGGSNTLSNIPQSSITGLATALAAKLALSGGTLTGALTTQAVAPDGDATRNLGLSSGGGWNNVYSYRFTVPGGAALENDGSGGWRVTGHHHPIGDNLYTSGVSSSYWSALYAYRHYLNSTAYLDGSTSGVLAVTGDIQMASAGTNAASVVTTAGAQTLSNKRVTKRVQTLADAATVTPDVDSYDTGKVTELSQTTVFANPTGTPTDMQQYIIRIKSTSARAISFGTQYRAIGVTLPTTTVAGKLLYIATQWEAGASKWDVLAVGQEA